MNNIEPNRINICLSCDENYAKYAGVVIASILANAKVDDDIYIYILDGNIKDSSKNKILSLKSIKNCSIEFIAINEEDFNDYRKIPNQEYISLSTYYRLNLATLLPSIKKIIYLDSDLIVCKSLQELYNIDLKNNVLGGVLDTDISLRKDNPKYVNAGVLLMDLDKIRQENIEHKFLQCAQNNWQNLKYGDQGVINQVLKDNILNIDEKFNLQSECYIKRSSFIKNPVIVHYIGKRKPWQKECWSVHRELYYKYLQLTPWKLSRLNLFINKDIYKINCFIGWFKHRPFFFFQKKFWLAFKKDMFTK